MWAFLSWHTLGAPDSMIGPNAWNTLRFLLFVLPLAALPLVLARPRRAFPAWAGIVAAATIPAVIVATPQLAVQFARLGPAEPLMVGGMAAGCALVLLGARRSLAGEEHSLFGRAWPWLFGWPLWLLGVYQKEASICFVAGAGFLYLFLADRWAPERPRADLLRRRPVQVAAVLLLVPLVHMGVKVASIGTGERTVYGAATPSSPGDYVARLRSAFGIQWHFMDVTLETPAWRVAAVAVTLTTLAIAWRRRRADPPWLPLALVAMAWTIFVFQGLTLAGGVAARYFIPTLSLIALTAGILVLEHGGSVVRLAAAGAAVIVLVGSVAARGEVADWSLGVRAEDAAVEAVAALDPRRCRVHVSGLGVESATALRVLVARQPSSSGCDGRFEAILVAGREPYPVTGVEIRSVCAGTGWVRLRTLHKVELHGCRHLRSDPRALGVLRQSRLAPPSS